MLRVLGDRGLIGILADQNTAEDAIFAEFFGILAATTTGTARLARHTGAPVLPVYTYWDSSLGKYRLACEPPLALQSTDDESADLLANTAAYNRVLEAYVRRFPDQWLWMHRRWKSRPPDEKPIYLD
jgi:KDO2-lipid IV(A) lauroyltransferase